jgi:hypothetical protein
MDTPVTAISKKPANKRYRRPSVEPTEAKRGRPRKVEHWEGPRQQAKLLAPWLAIANGTAEPAPLSVREAIALENIVAALNGESVDPEVMDDAVVARLVGSAYQRSVRASFERLVDAADKSRVRDPRLRGAIVIPGTVHLVWRPGGGELLGDLAVNADCRLTGNVLSPRAWFIAALQGAELLRFKRCLVCSNFYYMVRTGLDTCCANCGNVLRVRRFREEEERRIARVAALPKEKRDVREIARLFNVNDKKARGYIAKAKARRQGGMTDVNL